MTLPPESRPPGPTGPPRSEPPAEPTDPTQSEQPAGASSIRASKGPPLAPPSRRLLATAVLIGWAVVGLGILALATTGAVPMELAAAAIGLTLIGDLLVLAVLVRSVDRESR